MNARRTPWWHAAIALVLGLGVGAGAAVLGESSGTTLIAAEKSGRVARLMELDPKYCDVIVRRWEDFTGGTATRVEATAAAQDAPAA